MPRAVFQELIDFKRCFALKEAYLLIPFSTNAFEIPQYLLEMLSRWGGTSSGRDSDPARLRGETLERYQQAPHGGLCSLRLGIQSLPAQGLKQSPEFGFFRTVTVIILQIRFSNALTRERPLPHGFWSEWGRMRSLEVAGIQSCRARKFVGQLSAEVKLCRYCAET